jgi:hypothetical protein
MSGRRTLPEELRATLASTVCTTVPNMNESKLDCGAPHDFTGLVASGCAHA